MGILSFIPKKKTVNANPITISFDIYVYTQSLGI